MAATAVRVFTVRYRFGGATYKAATESSISLPVV